MNNEPIGNKLNNKVVKMVSHFLINEIYIYFTDGTYIKIASDSEILTEIIDDYCSR